MLRRFHFFLVPLALLSFSLTGHAQGISRPSNDIHSVDFANLRYGTGTSCFKMLKRPVVQLHDGEYKLKDVPSIGFGINKDEIFYGDLTGDGRDEAVVVTYCGGMHPVQQAYIFTMRAGKVTLLTKLEEGDRASGGLASPGECDGCSGIKIADGLLTVDRTWGPGACCPDQVETKTYRWNGGRLVQVGPVQRKKFINLSSEKVPSSAAVTTAERNQVKYYSGTIRFINKAGESRREIELELRQQGTKLQGVVLIKRGINMTQDDACLVTGSINTQRSLNLIYTGSSSMVIRGHFVSDDQIEGVFSEAGLPWQLHLNEIPSESSTIKRWSEVHLHPNENWATFWIAFRDAVHRRDRSLLRELMSENFAYGNYPVISTDRVFRELDQGNWKILEQTLEYKIETSKCENHVIPTRFLTNPLPCGKKPCNYQVQIAFQRQPDGKWKWVSMFFPGD